MVIKLQPVIEKYLLFGAVYFSVDGLIHLLNFKLGSTQSWPSSAITYVTLLNMIYGSFVILAGAISFEFQKDVKKYSKLIMLSAIWALLHGCLLIFISSKFNFMTNFSGYPSLYLWLPNYNYYLYFEAILLIVYSILVFIWRKEKT